MPLSRSSPLFNVRLEWFILTLVLCVLAAFLTQSRWLQPLDWLWYDTLINQQSLATPSDIVLINLEPDRLNPVDLNRRQWRLGDTAEIIQTLAKTRTQATLLNIDLTTRQPLDAEGERSLSEAIRLHGNVFLPIAISYYSPTNEINFRLPINLYANPAAHLGHTIYTTLQDGVVRTVPLLVHNSQLRWSHLAWMALNKNKMAQNPNAEPFESIHFVRFISPEKPFTVIQSREVLNGEYPSEFFRDKWVLIGAMEHPTKLVSPSFLFSARTISPLEILANTLNSLRQTQAIRPLPVIQQQGITMVFLVLTLLAFLRTSPRHYLMVMFIALGIIFFTSWLVFHFFSLWFWVASPATVGILAYPLWSWRRFTAIERYVGTQKLALVSESPTLAPSSKSKIGLLDEQLAWMQEAHAQVLKSKHFIQAIMNELPIAIILIHNDLITRINREGTIALGEKNEALLLGQTLRQALQNVHLPPSWLQENLTPPQSGEIIGADGRNYWANYQKLDDRQQLGTILTLTDISLIKREEQQRQELLRFVSHDLRSPLASIIAVIKMRRENPSLHDDNERMNAIAQYAEQSLKLAQEFLMLSHADNVDPTAFDVIDLSLAIESAISVVRVLAEEKNINVVRQIPLSAFVLGHYSMLERVFLNLLHNAVKFSPRDQSITIRLVQDNGHWCFTLVNEFHPVLENPILTKNKASTSLGLQFVHKVVDKHGGHFTMISKESTIKAELRLNAYGSD